MGRASEMRVALLLIGLVALQGCVAMPTGGRLAPAEEVARRIQGLATAQDGGLVSQTFDDEFHETTELGSDLEALEHDAENIEDVPELGESDLSLDVVEPAAKKDDKKTAAAPKQEEAAAKSPKVDDTNKADDAKKADAPASDAKKADTKKADGAVPKENKAATKAEQTDDAKKADNAKKPDDAKKADDKKADDAKKADTANANDAKKSEKLSSKATGTSDRDAFIAKDHSAEQYTLTNEADDAARQAKREMSAIETMDKNLDKQQKLKNAEKENAKKAEQGAATVSEHTAKAKKAHAELGETKVALEKDIHHTAQAALAASAAMDQVELGDSLTRGDVKLSDLKKRLSKLMNSKTLASTHNSEPKVADAPAKAPTTTNSGMVEAEAQDDSEEAKLDAMTKKIKASSAKTENQMSQMESSYSAPVVEKTAAKVKDANSIADELAAFKANAAKSVALASESDSVDDLGEGMEIEEHTNKLAELQRDAMEGLSETEKRKLQEAVGSDIYEHATKGNLDFETVTNGIYDVLSDYI